MVIITKNDKYTYDNVNKTLAGRRILEKEGVKVRLLSEIEIGQNPIFAFDEECTIKFSTLNIPVKKNDVIILSEVQDVIWQRLCEYCKKAFLDTHKDVRSMRLNSNNEVIEFFDCPLCGEETNSFSSFVI